MGSIAKIHEMLVGKQLSCAELTKSYLDEIDKSNSELNAYVNVTPDEAMKTAEAVDKKIAAGEEIGMLEGVPMTLKDNISTKGIETTCCSKILTGYKPIYDATVWELLQNQNAVMLGKTNMDEFAMGSSCETSYFGGAANPWRIYPPACVVLRSCRLKAHLRRCFALRTYRICKLARPNRTDYQERRGRRCCI